MRINRSLIGEPTNFRHIGHLGNGDLTNSDSDVSLILISVYRLVMKKQEFFYDKARNFDKTKFVHHIKILLAEGTRKKQRKKFQRFSL